MGGDWRDKAGGLMCVGHSSTSLCDRTRALLDAGVCGVVLQPPAVESPTSLFELIQSIKKYARRPLFVGVDHQTLQEKQRELGLSPLPLGLHLARSKDTELARHVGQTLGRKLRAVGIDLTLGPCVEIGPLDSTLPCDRSLGSDAELAARLGAALIEGQQSEGVAACAQHFPGHGSGCTSQERELSHLSHGLERLESVELIPFRAAAHARVAGMMLGHIVVDSIDDQLPASLHRAIVFGLLRQKLSYRGLLMIDDVDSHAFCTHYSRDTIARLGVSSGADCFLCGRRPESAFELIDAIERGVRAGEILPERIESARRRIAPLLHRYVKGPEDSPDLSCFGTTPLTPHAKMPL